jgi:3-hydroxybutyryl-CoA dehydrogenase
MSTLNNIVALGVGRMGRGIAHMFAYAGRPVSLLDIKDRSSEDFAKLEEDAHAEIRTNLEFLSTLEVSTQGQVNRAMQLITVHCSDDAQSVLAAADIVIEGVPETQAAKSHALKVLSEYSRADTLIASTTSTMPVVELQKEIVNPQRFLNAHFLNPAYLIPLVEISPGPDTDEDVVESVMTLFKSVGKEPVRCGAKPGYIVPRLQTILMAEASRMLEEGVVTAEDMDRAIKYGFGPRFAAMGVVEFMDWGGLDTVFNASHQLAEALDSPAHAAATEVGKMVEQGKAGLRAGQGYYDFRKIDAVAWQQEKLSRFVKLLAQLDQIPVAGV